MGRTLENQHFWFGEVHRGEHLLKCLHPGGPGESLLYGYLGIDEVLDTVIEEDRKTLEELGITYDRLGGAIESLFTGDAVAIGDNPLVRRNYIHSPVCPWGDYCTTSPFDLGLKVTEIIILNRARCPTDVYEYVQTYPLDIRDYAQLVEQDWAMIFSDLHPHLIRDHHFLEGKETPYRIDPHRAKRHLNL